MQPNLRGFADKLGSWAALTHTVRLEYDMTSIDDLFVRLKAEGKNKANELIVS